MDWVVIDDSQCVCAWCAHVCWERNRWNRGDINLLRFGRCVHTCMHTHIRIRKKRYTLAANISIYENFLPFRIQDDAWIPHRVPQTPMYTNIFSLPRQTFDLTFWIFILNFYMKNHERKKNQRQIRFDTRLQGIQYIKLIQKKKRTEKFTWFSRVFIMINLILNKKNFVYTKKFFFLILNVYLWIITLPRGRSPSLLHNIDKCSGIMECVAVLIKSPSVMHTWYRNWAQDCRIVTKSIYNSDQQIHLN